MSKSEKIDITILGKILKIKIKEEKDLFYINTRDISLVKFFFDKGVCYFYSKFTNMPLTHIPSDFSKKLSEEDLSLIQEAYEQIIGKTNQKS